MFFHVTSESECSVGDFSVSRIVLTDRAEFRKLSLLERAVLGELMKAIIHRNYGSPDVLQYQEIEKPTPGDDDILIKVRAASVNPLDWKTLTGGPYIVRTLLGLSKKIRRIGVDVAGQVEAVGKNITQFKPGDEVFGTCREAFAEYARSSESGSFMKSALVMKPEKVTFEQAASAPIAALTALQGLRDWAPSPCRSPSHTART